MMVEDKCPICGSKCKHFRLPSSPLDDVVCPNCGSHKISSWIGRSSIDSVAVDWTCHDCGHKWSSRHVLSKKVLARLFPKS